LDLPKCNSLKVVLTSPLVARQGTQGLPTCPTNVGLFECNIKQETRSEPIPSTECVESRSCNYQPNNIVSCSRVGIECVISSISTNEFHCSYVVNGTEPRCGFICKSCRNTLNNELECNSCSNGIKTP
ncbi:2424_t:CDS:2, partial [Cetraspora pellucida]